MNERQSTRKNDRSFETQGTETKGLESKTGTNAPRAAGGEGDLLSGFERLMGDLKGAISRFQDDQTPENLAGIVTAMNSFGLTGTDLWRRAADYTRRHPVQVAGLVSLLFFAYKGMVRESLPQPANTLAATH